MKIIDYDPSSAITKVEKIAPLLSIKITWYVMFGNHELWTVKSIYQVLNILNEGNERKGTSASTRISHLSMS